MKQNIFKAGVCLVVAFAMSALQALATNEVMSVTTVGYVKITVVSNVYIQIGMPFDSLTNGAFLTVSEILGTNDIPAGSKALVFNGVGYNTELYNAVQKRWAPNTNRLFRGDAFFAQVPANTNLCLLGQVPTISTPQAIDLGYQMVTYPFPIDVTFSNTFLGTNGNAGDQILKFNGVGYSTWNFNTGSHKWFPTNPPLSIKCGEGFWYKAAKLTNFVELVPYTLP